MNTALSRAFTAPALSCLFPVRKREKHFFWPRDFHATETGSQFCFISPYGLMVIRVRTSSTGTDYRARTLDSLQYRKQAIAGHLLKHLYTQTVTQSQNHTQIYKETDTQSQNHTQIYTQIHTNRHRDTESPVNWKSVY